MMNTAASINEAKKRLLKNSKNELKSEFEVMLKSERDKYCNLIEEYMISKLFTKTNILDVFAQNKIETEREYDITKLLNQIIDQQDKIKKLTKIIEEIDSLDLDLNEISETYFVPQYYFALQV